MDRAAYLSDADVRAFLDWAEPIVTQKWRIDHSWTSPKWGTRCFETLFDAYKGYEWKFRVNLPDHGMCEGESYEDSVRVLDALRRQLRENAERGDTDGFLEAAIAVVEWGGVRRNRQRLRDLGDEVLPRLTANARLLDPDTADLDHLSGIEEMNSGFSKIYSLLLTDFPIYDSRVACALASLVRWFCQEKDRESIPGALAFRVLPAQGKARRDPSGEHFKFPKVHYPGTARYAQSNVMAAWLLGELAKHPPFCGEDDPLHALQSAMFMIGYAPLERPCEQCR